MPNNDISMAETYVNLATNARDQKNDERAEEWLQKAMHIFEENGAVSRAIHAGRLAERACEIGVAEKAYRKALKIAKTNRDDKSIAYCYQYLGNLACLQNDYAASRTWYAQALEAYEKHGDKDRVARCCVSLGNLNLARSVGAPRDFASAKKGFRKALEIDDDAKWWDRFILYGRLWRYRFRSVFSQ